MIQIQSNRIRLLALDLTHLNLLLDGRNQMEKSLGLTLSNFQLNTDESFMDEFSMALEKFVIPNVMRYPESYAWYSHWLIIDRAKRITIGGIGANGLPDKNGQVTIGYFIDRKFEGMHYATEAVQCFTGWMFRNPSLKSVIADTLEGNIASQKVLQNAGFVFAGPVEEGLRWKLKPG